jgi:NAD(P)-dependent dehydrogenase (short-subunit alcohol dehydrogenase family)
MADLSLFDLTGRKALVTGGSRGIGRAIAEGLARAGADVAVSARSRASSDETVTAIAGLGRRTAAIEMDVSRASDCAAGVTDAADALGGLDILVNNAGTEEVRPSLQVDEALWDRILDTNLKGAFFAAQAACALMKETGGGAVVNMCSLTSEVGIPTAVPYGSSKSGLLGMTRALSAEWAPLQVRVNAIAPGYFRTAMTDAFFADQAWAEAMLAKIPQRRFGKLSDLIGAAIFLCSPASDYMTGQCLVVDGGFLASI